MLTTLPADGFVGLTFAMGSLLMGSFVLMLMLAGPWREGEKSDEYLKNMTESYFAYAGSGLALLIAAFLGGLTILFGGVSADGAAVTADMGQKDAAMKFYFLSAFTIVLSFWGLAKLVGAIRKETDKRLVPLRVVSTFFCVDGALFAAILVALVAFGNTTDIAADYVMGGLFVLAGVTLGSFWNIHFRAWYMQQLASETFDREQLTKGTKWRFFVTMAITFIPTAYGCFVIIT